MNEEKPKQKMTDEETKIVRIKRALDDKRSKYTYCLIVTKPAGIVKEFLRSKKIDYSLRGRNFFIDKEIAERRFSELLDVMV